MGYTIPGCELNQEQKEHFRNTVMQTLAVKACSFNMFPPSANLTPEQIMREAQKYLTIRDLLPSDLGLKSWLTRFPAGKHDVVNNNSSIINNNNNSIIGIYKFLETSTHPRAIELEIIISNETVGLNNLETCYGGLPTVAGLAELLMDLEAKEVMERMAGDVHLPEIFGQHAEGWFQPPYILLPNRQVRISVTYRDGPVADDNLVLVGLIAEPKGMRVA